MAAASCHFVVYRFSQIAPRQRETTAAGLNHGPRHLINHQLRRTAAPAARFPAIRPVAAIAARQAAEGMANFERRIQESPLPTLVVFCTVWCGPCRTLDKVLKNVTPLLKDRVQILKVDTEVEEEVAGRYNIHSLPTLALFKDGMEPAHRHEGYLGEVELRLWLHQRL